MTYTTKKILANFLNNDEGLLSKKFIETATVLFGQVPAKRAFREALRRNDGTTDFFIKDPIVVIPSAPAPNQDGLITELVSQWYPGTARCIQVGQNSPGIRKNLFSIYRVTTYRHDSVRNDEHIRMSYLIDEHMRNWREELALPPIDSVLNGHPSEITALLTELLFETVYDSVTAQGYNRPADSETLRRYFMSLMRYNSNFDWSRWFDSTPNLRGMVNRDRSEMVQAMY